MRVLDNGFVEIAEVHGSDLTIVNAARVSMGKESYLINEGDKGLLSYLAKHEHMSPFRHVDIIFHIKMPIFVMRQFVKHRIGVEINEISGRYVEFAPDFYVPDKFRLQSSSNKQGSNPEIPETIQGLSHEQWREIFAKPCYEAFHHYKVMIEAGIAKEIARMVLPLSLYTEIRVKMSLEAIMHFLHLREESHAQFEIQEYARVIKTLTHTAFPYAFEALYGVRNHTQGSQRDL